MRTIELKVYEFDELSKEAKQRALENYALECEYVCSYEAIESLKKFMLHFNCRLHNYSIDWLEKYRCSIQIDIPDYIRYHLTDDELKEYIEGMGEYDPKTLKGLGDCLFTGYCADEDAADGARKAFYGGERDIYEILYAGYESWWEACNSDFEYQFSEEGYSELCELNDYEFNEEGELI